MIKIDEQWVDRHIHMHYRVKVVKAYLWPKYIFDM